MPDPSAYSYQDKNIGTDCLLFTIHAPTFAPDNQCLQEISDRQCTHADVLSESALYGFRSYIAILSVLARVCEL
jgi:hypothetical protein